MQLGTHRLSKIQIGLAAAGVFVLAIIMLILTMQNGNTDETPPAGGSPSTSGKQAAEIKRRLCYVDAGRVGCYTDDTFKTTSSPAIWASLDDVVRVVPAASDDKLAVIAGEPGDYRVYISKQDFQLTRVNIQGYVKAEDTVAWLPDGSGLIFEASRANVTSSSRLIVRYNIDTKQITELTKSNVLSADAQVSENTIVFRRYDLKILPSVWQWHKMNLDGTGDTDLGVKGTDGAVRGGKLILAGDYFNPSVLTEVDLVTKQQRTINFPGLKAPSPSSSGLVALLDGQLAFAYKDDESKNGPYDRIGLIDLTAQKMRTTKNVGVGYPFQTQLFNKK